jgi:hypothetical protein
MFEVVLLIWIICGIAAGIVGTQRGANGCLWFGLGFLSGPIGLAVSFTASPDRQCQFCFKPVHPQATKCPYCQSNLPPVAARRSPPIYKPLPWTRKDRFVLWGIGSLLAVCVVGAIVVNHAAPPPVYKPSVGAVVFLNEDIIRRMESGADAESLIQAGVAFRIAPSDVLRVTGKVGDGALQRVKVRVDAGPHAGKDGLVIFP